MFATMNALAPAVRTARVLAIGTNGAVQLDLDGLDTGEEVWARRAVPYDVAVGQQALVLADAEGEWYVIGLLQTGPAPSRVKTTAGTIAEVAGPPDAEKLRVLSPGGELLFEHDPAARVTRLAMPAGDLELLAPQGRITLAGAELRLVAGEIDLHAAHAVRLAVPGVEADRGTTLVADRERLAFRSEKLEATAEHAELAVENAKFSGARWSLAVESLAIAVDALETTARSVVEKAQNVYRQVAELLQVQAGRLRHLVAGAYHLKSEDAYVKTEKDFKVQAEQIHLG
jgi:hypothetical protein